MASRHTQIADALVTYLNGLSLSQAFTSQRVKVPTFALEETRSLRVDIILGKAESKFVTRGYKADRTYDIEIVVQDALDLKSNTVTTDADGLVELCEEIEAALAGQQISGATLTAVSRESVFDNTVAEISHHFVCVITATYREIAA